jgi:hypothetical protein
MVQRRCTFKEVDGKYELEYECIVIILLPKKDIQSNISVVYPDRIKSGHYPLQEYKHLHASDIILMYKYQ